MIQLGNKQVQYIFDNRYLTNSQRHKLGELLSEATIVGSNLKFDIKWAFKHLNYKWGTLWDIMVGELVIWNDYKPPKSKYANGFYTLAGMWQRYCNPLDFTNQLSLFGPQLSKTTRLKFVEDEEYRQYKPFDTEDIMYGAFDVVAPMIIKEKQLKTIKDLDLGRAADVEMAAQLPISYMEYCGMYVDKDLWMKSANHYHSLTESALQHLKSTYGDINYNSSKQLIKLLKEHKVPTKVLDKAKSIGDDLVYKDTSSYDHIKKFKKDYPLVSDYIIYKKHKTTTSKFGAGYIDKHLNTATNRIHPSYWPHITTSRLSCFSPNLQQVPSEQKTPGLRSSFTNSDPSTTLVVCDYSAQESRLLAQLSGEKSMIDFFNGKNPDMHSYVSSKMFGIPMSEARTTLIRGISARQIAKVLSFTLAYGGGAHRIRDVFQVDLKTASQWVKDYNKAWLGLQPHFKKKFKQSLRVGRIVSDANIGGSIYMPQIQKFLELDTYINKRKLLGWDIHPLVWKNYIYLKGVIKRSSQNYPIQYAGAKMTKLALIYLYHHIVINDWWDKVWICLAVHDEIVVECPLLMKQEVSDALKNCMEKAGKVYIHSVPMEVSPVISNQWEH